MGLSVGVRHDQRERYTLGNEIGFSSMYDHFCCYQLALPSCGMTGSTWRNSSFLKRIRNQVKLWSIVSQLRIEEMSIGGIISKEIRMHCIEASYILESAEMPRDVFCVTSSDTVV